ncbi:MAG: response regulator [Planctomycetes bacterium]|nr:response regulator [Planctomycetota bacterium]MCB9890894.1 response regulator [Planctomycetota bacterium]
MVPPALLKPSAKLFVPGEVADQILVVDDEHSIAHSLTLYLNQVGVRAHGVQSGHEALEELRTGRYFLVVTDISMPDMDGLELLREIRHRHTNIDVIFITGHLHVQYTTQAIKEGAFDFFKKPFDYDELVLSVQRARERQDLVRRAFEAEKIEERNRVTTEHIRESMAAFAQMIDAKNPYTRHHSTRVGHYAARLAKAMGLSEEFQERVRFGGQIHDIGKIGIPDCVLDKPGPLSPSERHLMESHAAIGADCLRQISCMSPYLTMVELHHERWDGRGYPHGLVEEESPVEARIVKIADYYDAITSNRPYRAAMDLAEAVEIMKEERGRHFEPELLDIFLETVPYPILERRNQL